MKRLPRLAQLQGFVLDLDGTVYLGDHLLPGAADFFHALRARDKRWIFLTNNSSTDADHYAKKLTRLGIPTESKDILTSGDATIDYLRSLAIHRVFLLGTPILEANFHQAGFRLTNRRPDAVVLGFDKTLTYQKLETASRLIQDGVPFIATHGDILCPTPGGSIPDAGAIIAFLTKATGCRPTIIGKPNVRMLRTAIKRLALSMTDVAMIGDRLYTDIKMGRRAKVTTVLVLSGEATHNDLGSSKEQPDLVVPALGSLVEAMKRGG